MYTSNYIESALKLFTEEYREYPGIYTIAGKVVSSRCGWTGVPGSFTWPAEALATTTAAAEPHEPHLC